MSYFTDVVDWHRRFAVPVADHPTALSPDRHTLRLALLGEEYKELVDALEADDLAGAAGEAFDLIVVTLGAMAEAGVPFDAVWAAKLAAIHSKADPDGTIHRRADGKVLKGQHYREANLAAVLAAPAASHVLRVTAHEDQVVLDVECHEPETAFCRTNPSGDTALPCQAVNWFDCCDMTEVHDPDVKAEPIADGMPVTVSWSDYVESWVWRGVPAGTPQAVTA